MLQWCAIRAVSKGVEEVLKGLQALCRFVFGTSGRKEWSWSVGMKGEATPARTISNTAAFGWPCLRTAREKQCGSVESWWRAAGRGPRGIRVGIRRWNAGVWAIKRERVPPLVSAAVAARAGPGSMVEVQAEGRAAAGAWIPAGSTGTAAASSPAAREVEAMAGGRGRHRQSLFGLLLPARAPGRSCRCIERSGW